MRFADRETRDREAERLRKSGAHVRVYCDESGYRLSWTRLHNVAQSEPKRKRASARTNVSGEAVGSLLSPRTSPLATTTTRRRTSVTIDHKHMTTEHVNQSTGTTVDATGELSADRGGIAAFRKDGRTQSDAINEHGHSMHPNNAKRTKNYKTTAENAPYSPPKKAS
jgi:hypothetical protein